MSFSEASKEWVIVHVGSENEPFIFPKRFLWDREYFRNADAGIMYLTVKEGNKYELEHPALPSIQLRDFEFAAQFLESGSFGTHPSDDAGDIDEIFAEIVSAWDVGEKLGMTDMLEYCVNKLELIAPIDPHHCLSFATILYQSPGIGVEARSNMKNLLTQQLAEQMHIYLREPESSGEFLDRFLAIPALEVDVLEKRSRLVRERERDEDEDDVNDSD